MVKQDTLCKTVLEMIRMECFMDFNNIALFKKHFLFPSIWTETKAGTNSIDTVSPMAEHC